MSDKSKKDTAHPSCRILAELLVAHGVTDAVISPGSRNTPMIIALGEREQITSSVITDERAAAFYALGRAMVSQRPVAICCTSGTALFDYAPAIAEAYYQGVPLIVISADRPAQWIDQDDSQTLRQPGALDHIVKSSYDLPVVTDLGDREKCHLVNRIVNDALLTALNGRKGPIHINIQLDGILGQTTDDMSLPEYCTRKITMVEPTPSLPKETLDSFARQLLDNDTLVVAGFLPPSDKLNHAVSLLSTLPNVYVMHETISNLRLRGRHTAIDSILTAHGSEQLDRLRPRLTMTFGGALVSRLIKEFLRETGKISQMEHWSIGRQHTTVDCFQSLTRRIEMDPAWFIRQLTGHAHRLLNKGYRPKCDSNYAAAWEEKKKQGIDRMERHVQEAGWSDLKAYATIFRNIPDNANLFLSNGTSVRYAQLLMERMPHICMCNRGVSGIDGSTATALGGASVYKGISVLVTGDMSLLYDCGALGLDNGTGRMVIIAVNNNGGGIFRFIRATRNIPERERYLSPKPVAEPKNLAATFGWEYRHAEDEESLRRTLEDTFKSNSPRILVEVNTGDGDPDALIRLLTPES